MSQPSVFIIYASKDEPFRDKLEEHLEVLQRKGYISIFKRVTAGENISQVLEQNLREADIILPLVSIDFLNSPVSQSIDFDGFTKHQKKIIPILIRDCLVEETPFQDLRILPSKNPVDRWSNEDEAFTYIVRELLNIVRNKEENSISIQEYKDLLDEIRKEKEVLRKKYSIINTSLLITKLLIIYVLAFLLAPIVTPIFPNNSLITYLTTSLLFLGLLYLWYLKKYYSEELVKKLRKVSILTLYVGCITLIFYLFLLKGFTIETDYRCKYQVKGLYLNETGQEYLKKFVNVTDYDFLRNFSGNPRNVWEYVGLIETLFMFSIITMVTNMGIAIFVQIENQENKHLNENYDRIMPHQSSS